MGVTQDNRKFKITKKQSNPTNPTGGTDIKNKTFDIDKKTINENQGKNSITKKNGTTKL